MNSMPELFLGHVIGEAFELAQLGNPGPRATQVALVIPRLGGGVLGRAAQCLRAGARARQFGSRGGRFPTHGPVERWQILMRERTACVTADRSGALTAKGT